MTVAQTADNIHTPWPQAVTPANSSIAEKPAPNTDLIQLRVLLELRAASLRFQLALNETRYAADLLSHGHISPDGAIGLLAEALQNLDGGS